MSTEILTKKPEPSQPLTPAQEDPLHERARRNVERVHWVKANVAAFVVGMLVLVPVWLIVEWQSAGGFERWSEGGNPGDWDAWILYIAVPWFLWVSFVVLRAYVERNKDAEIEHEMRRLRAG